MNNKIYIRADGSPKIGLGHIIRCFALAKMLKGSFSIKFVSMHIPEDIEITFITEGFSVTKISKEEDFFDLLKGDEVVVLDHYGLDSSYQKRIKKIGSKLVCIDDLHNKEFYADLIINHSPGIVPSDYNAQSYTKFALGPQYALLRPAFLKSASAPKKIQKFENVLICFGGSDYTNLTKKVLQVVREKDDFNFITVILGAAYPYHDSLIELIETEPRIRLFSSLNEEDMFTEIQNADLAIVPSSGILFEVLAGGSLPIICYYAENQKKLFNYFKYNNILPSFDGINFDGNQLKEELTKILNGVKEIEEIPLRNQISRSSLNNLEKFKELSAME